MYDLNSCLPSESPRLSHETQPAVTSFPFYSWDIRGPQVISDLHQAPYLERWILGSLFSFGEHRGLMLDLRSRGSSPVHLFAPSFRVTELALSVEHLQNQNTEKDQVNRTLSDKLEALVRCGSMMWHQPNPWLLAEGQAAWTVLNVPPRVGAVLTVPVRLTTVTFTSSVPFSSHYTVEETKARGLQSSLGSQDLDPA